MCVPVRSSSISASHGNGGDVVHMPQPCSSWHSLPLPIATTETNRMKPITVEDVQQVHFLIEGCLCQSMTKKDTCLALDALWNIDQRFTSLVWDRLESENPEFFAEYKRVMEMTGDVNALNIGWNGDDVQ